jgi:hypothetical protein
MKKLSPQELEDRLIDFAVAIIDPKEENEPLINTD